MESKGRSDSIPSRAEDPRIHSPSVSRNREVVGDVLRSLLPPTAKVLEVGSGSGEHAVHVAGALPGIVWIPTDPDHEARASISAWIHATGLENVMTPIDLDVERSPWALGDHSEVDAIVTLNMIHISPPSTTTGLLDGAGRTLRAGGMLILYGPFMREGKHTAPSNEDFDRWLKDRDTNFGVRDLDEVEHEASEHGLVLAQVIEMPANNLTVVFERRQD